MTRLAHAEDCAFLLFMFHRINDNLSLLKGVYCTLLEVSRPIHEPLFRGWRYCTRVASARVHVQKCVERSNNVGVVEVIECVAWVLLVGW